MIKINLNRRDFIQSIFAALLSFSGVSRALARNSIIIQDNYAGSHDDHIKDYLHKMRYFDFPNEEDIYLSQNQLKILQTTVHRLKRLQKFVGHGNFCLLNFDNALKIARNYLSVGSFTNEELNFLELIFYSNSAVYGFLGQKPLDNLTDQIKARNTVKIPCTGNYLYKGLPLETYNNITKDIGEMVTLTSGLRGITKQFLLFLNKAELNKGNLSLASRSLAPPGYSYHGIGDFDVGQTGYGPANFTKRFTETKVYERLKDLGYINLRYPQKNLIGVRFEPWHIRIRSG